MNTPGRLFILCSIIISFSCRAGDKPEDNQRRASEWDKATAERLFRKGAWREGVAYLGRALRLDPQNSAAARDLWSAVVYGEGDRNTVPTLVLRQEAKINVAVFSPDGRRILTASADKTARLWDATTGAPVGEPMRHEDEVVAAMFSPNGARIATMSKDGTARLWDAATLKPVGKPMRHEHPFDDGAFHAPDGVLFNSTGTRIVTQCNAGGVDDLWDAATGTPVGEALPPHGAGYHEPVTFSPDGRRLATMRDDTARVLDSANGKPIGKLLKHPVALSSVAFSPDGSRLLTVAEDSNGHGKAHVWSIAAGKLLYTLSMKSFVEIEEAPLSAEFSPDGTRIVTVVERHGQLWDAATGKRVGGVLWCASSDAEGGAGAFFSPDSACLLLSASEDKLVRSWDCETGTQSGFPARDAASVLRHPEEVLEVFFTADGMRIVTTCQDHAVRVWDAQKGTLIGQPLRHAHRNGEGLEKFAVSPEGRRILTVDAENTVRVWQVDEPRLLDEPLPPMEKETVLPGGAPPQAFIEALCGYRFSDDGVLHEIAETETAALRARLRAPAENASEWRPLIIWWLTAPQDRPLFPGDKLTRRERADEELATGTWEGISNAYALDPTHPLVHIAMAKDAHGRRAAFLRAYGVAHLPADPVIRGRAAEMLKGQGQPELAQNVIGAKPVK
jgi:WD40 repeat protein